MWRLVACCKWKKKPATLNDLYKLAARVSAKIEEGDVRSVVRLTVSDDTRATSRATCDDASVIELRLLLASSRQTLVRHNSQLTGFQPIATWFGQYTPLSDEGSQQGNPLGLLLLCDTITSLVKQVKSDYNIWYHGRSD